MKKWISLLGVASLLSLASCSVERMDRCKTTPSACPGLIGAPKMMSLLELSPASGSVTALPTAVEAIFNGAVNTLDSSKFVISGTCVNLPVVSSVTMSVDDTVATANLTGGVCTNNQTFTVTVTPASVTSLEGIAGSGSALSRSYTMIALGPTATLATPSSTHMTSSGSSTIALTYTGATLTTLTDAGVTKNEVGVNCIVNVSGASASGALLTLSACSGDGHITVSVNAGTAADGPGNLSTASPVSVQIVVDNTGPTLPSLNPGSAYMVAAPTSVVATFSEAVTALSASNFAVSGTCSVAPAVSGVVMSVADTVATATLAGGVCTDTQKLVVSVNPMAVTDTLGNAGTGSLKTRTYTVSTSGPIATLATPSSTLINSAGSATIALTYIGAVETSLTNAGVTKNETGVSCTVVVSGATEAGATLTVNGCSGNGTITVSVNAGTATDALNNASSASAASAVITVDNTGPTLSSLTPGSGNFNTMPPSVVATFSEAMTAVTADKFVVSGNCSILSSVTGVAMSSSDKVATASLSAPICALAETMTVTVNPTMVSDVAGNAGTGSGTAVTYTKINGTAVLTITGPNSLGDTSCQDASQVYTITNTGNADATLSAVGISGSVMSIENDQCSTAGSGLGVLTPGGTCTVKIKSQYGSGSGNGVLSIDYHNQLTNTSVTKNLTVIGGGC